MDGGGWDLARIAPFVTEETRLQLAAMVVNNVPGVHDRLAWGETSNGKFTVKSAYELITRDDAPRPYMGNYLRLCGT